MSSTKVITGLVRFSYAHVHEPHAMNEGDDPKYSVSVIIPKSDTATIEKIKAAIEAAKEEGKHKKFEGKIPANIKQPLKDGDIERPDDAPYENSFFIGANSDRKPEIVDVDREPLMTKDEFYSGCYGRVSINFYPYNAGGVKGIAAGLGNIQKLRDGEKLSGGSSAAEDFGDDFEDPLM